MEDRYITDHLMRKFTHDLLETETSGDMPTYTVTAPRNPRCHPLPERGGKSWI